MAERTGGEVHRGNEQSRPDFSREGARPIKEFEIEEHDKEFILDWQLEDPTSIKERLQKAARAVRINETLRKMWADSPSHLLRVESDSAHTAFETDSVAFANLLIRYLTECREGLSYTARYCGNLQLVYHRIANFNYQLSK